MCPGKTAEPIEMPFGADLGMPTGEGRTNPFATVRGDKSAMRPFAELLCTLVWQNTRCLKTKGPLAAVRPKGVRCLTR